MERALASPFDQELRSPPCDCSAAVRMEDNNGADRRLRTSVASLDLLRSVVRSEAHLSRELARASALLYAARQSRGARAALSSAPLGPQTGESADAADEGDGGDGRDDDSAERT